MHKHIRLSSCVSVIDMRLSNRHAYPLHTLATYKRPCENTGRREQGDQHSARPHKTSIVEFFGYFTSIFSILRRFHEVNEVNA
eukprot:gene26108-biopygen14097